MFRTMELLGTIGLLKDPTVLLQQKVSHGVTYGNGVFIAVGIDGTILTSSDNGTTWTSMSSGTTASLYEVTFTE